MGGLSQPLPGLPADAAIAKAGSGLTWVKRGPGWLTIYVVGVIVCIHTVCALSPHSVTHKRPLKPLKSIGKRVGGSGLECAERVPGQEDLETILPWPREVPMRGRSVEDIER